MEHNGNLEKTSQVYIVTIIYSNRLQWPEIRKSSILGVQIWYQYFETMQPLLNSYTLFFFFSFLANYAP